MTLDLPTELYCYVVGLFLELPTGPVTTTRYVTEGRKRQRKLRFLKYTSTALIAGSFFAKVMELASVSYNYDDPRLENAAIVR